MQSFQPSTLSPVNTKDGHTPAALTERNDSRPMGQTDSAHSLLAYMEATARRMQRHYPGTLSQKPRVQNHSLKQSHTASHSLAQPHTAPLLQPSLSCVCNATSCSCAVVSRPTASTSFCTAVAEAAAAAAAAG